MTKRTDREFVLTFSVSGDFLRGDPDVASQYVEVAKAREERRKAITTPRGAVYRLIGPAQRWRQGQDGYDFAMNRWTFATRRLGRYVRPSRVTPDLRIPDVTFDTLTIPVTDGKVTLPSGATVESSSRYVAVPVGVL